VPKQLAAGDDTEGQLMFVDGGLVAVLVHLSDQQDEAGMWLLEAEFGGVDVPGPAPFVELSEAQDWITHRLARA
jgi:hypothetical protein